ncbi:MAG: SemiSWEET family sugar transporter [Silvibacterium sp.]|nr:SemiSWEET family sugar transporter [Silvibacterium sp.]MBV8630597.1 SemiSWEET family sugar transporter [Silvibacterium sp.]
MNLVGYIAAICTTISFLPQLIRVYRLKSAHEISLTMFLVYSLGVSLWLLYGIFIGSLPVIVANALSVVLSLAILVLKIHYDRRRRAASAKI